MSRTSNIRKSVVLLASVAALAAPTAATAYPVIPDDPGTPAAQAQGFKSYLDQVKRGSHVRPPHKPPHWPCPYRKVFCPTP